MKPESLLLAFAIVVGVLIAGYLDRPLADKPTTIERSDDQ